MITVEYVTVTIVCNFKRLEGQVVGGAQVAASDLVKGVDRSAIKGAGRGTGNMATMLNVGFYLAA
ncbi:MAG: hypothetical protein GY892_18480 [Shimia sp.]|nr:hypothetical protein [Shimia sp.]